MTVLKPTDLKSDVGGVLDRAIDSPQYVMRNGQLLVITKVNLVPTAAHKSWEVDWSDLLDRPKRRGVNPNAAEEIREAGRRR